MNNNKMIQSKQCSLSLNFFVRIRVGSGKHDFSLGSMHMNARVRSRSQLLNIVLFPDIFSYFQFRHSSCIEANRFDTPTCIFLVDGLAAFRFTKIKMEDKTVLNL